MALNSLGLGFVFTARDLASRTMRRVGNNFNVMSKKTAAGAKGMGVAAAAGAAGIGLMVAGVAALGGGLALANQAGAFEQGIAKVGAISRATADELEMLSQRAKQAGIDTQFSPTEATEGLSNLAAQGFNAAQSAELLGPALDLAAGGQISIADASATTAAAVKVFSLSMDEASLAADQLLRISNVTALQAKDLQLALGTVSRGAVATKQSIDEMLPSIGLVKNTGVDASVAASSVSSALQFMAKNAKSFKKIGVEVTDAQGKFRPFMDIVLDADKALSEKFPNAADKTAKALQLFGRFGVTAFTGISEQVNAGIPDATGKILKGAEAVQFLRDSMTGAKGAAAEFKDALLNTFEGQKTLLKGSLQTLGIELGETFAKAFKPIVSAVIDVVNRVIKFIGSIPGPVKDALGKVILIFGALATAAGGGILVSLVFGAIAAAAETIAIALAIAAGALAAVGAVVGTIVLAFKGYQIAMEGAEKKTNFFVRTWQKLKLAFTAVMALISGKPVSKEVVDDLQKAENAGVLAFVQSVGRLIRRVKLFVGAVQLGFRTVMKTARPVFDALFEAFEGLGESLGFMGEGFNKAAGSPIQKFIRAGAVVGTVVAKVILFIVRAITLIVRWVTGFVKGVKSAFQTFEPVFNIVVALVKDVAEQFGKLVREVFPGVEKGADGAGGFVETMGKIFGFVATVIRFTVIPAIIFFLATLSVAIRIWRFVAGIIKRAIDKIIIPKFKAVKALVLDVLIPAFKTMKDKVVGFFQPIIDKIKMLIELLSDAFKKVDEFFDISGKVTGAAESIANFAGFTLEDAPEALSLDVDDEPTLDFGNRPTIPLADSTSRSAEAQVAAGKAARTGSNGLTDEQIAKMAVANANATAAAIKKLPPPMVAIDGQRTGDTLRRATDDSDNREFRQVGVEG